MKLGFAQVPRDRDGNVMPPTLVLQTLSDKVVGAIGSYFNLSLDAKFAEVSTLSFDVPAYSNGETTPFYNKITANKIVQILPYGRFLLAEPTISGDGIEEVKSCECKSLEYELTRSRLIIEKGTYRLFSPVDNTNSILGFVLSMFPHWRVGSVDPTLYNRYRTFEDTDEKVLDFLLDTAQESFKCIFVFDTVNRKIDVLDANDDVIRTPVPVYLSYDNLLKSVEVHESIDEQFTVLDVRGAEPLDIRQVNPIGSNKIYNLDWFIENGDLPENLAARWRSWESYVAGAQPAFAGYMMLYSSATALVLTEKAKLADEESELAVLNNLLDVTLRGFAEGAKTKEEVQEAQEKCDVQKTVVETQKLRVSTAERTADQYLETAKNIRSVFALDAFFTNAELTELRRFFVEDTFEDETFATFDVDISNASNVFLQSTQVSVSVTGAEIVEVTLAESVQKRLFHITGGTISVSDGESTAQGDIVYCNFEVDLEINKSLITAYVSDVSVGDKMYPSGNLSVFGTGSSLNVETSSLSFQAADASTYFTPNATEYQKFNVATELYEYAQEKLKEIARPTYEFSVSSANLVWGESFQSFADKFSLGSPIYLDFGSNVRVTPLLIGVQLDFENPESFSLTFSNRFRRPDRANTMKDLLSESHSTSRILNMAQYKYGAFTGTGADTMVKALVTSGLDAATASVLAGLNSSVKIGADGITVQGDGESEYIRMNHGMIAFFDPDSQTAKMAIGKFHDTNCGDMYGVIAPSIVGTLLAGESLVIENRSADGSITQFKVDSSGAFLNNSRLYIQNETGGKIALDPSYGIIAGVKDLYTLNGTTLTPTFIGANGDIELDDDGMPTNSNLFVDIKTGNVYLRGTVYAERGSFTGDVTARNFFFADGDDVKTMLSTTQKKIPGEYLNAKGILVQNDDGGTTFMVDEHGNVTLGGKISWNDATPQLMIRFSSQSEIAAGKTPLTDTNWHETMVSADRYRTESNNGGETWCSPYLFRGKDGSDASVTASNVGEILERHYNISTASMTPYELVTPHIYSADIYSPTIYTNDLYIYTAMDSGDGTIHFMNSYTNTEMMSISALGVVGTSYGVTSMSGTNLRIIADKVFSDIGEGIVGTHVSSIGLYGHLTFGSAREDAYVDFSNATITWGGNAPTAVFA